MSVNKDPDSVPADGPETRPVLAIDFGTSNTYVTKCPGDKEDPVGVDFGDGRDGIATAILYRDGKEPQIGTHALEEFGEGSVEHSDYRIRAQFKPDLAHSEEARTNARDFLTAMLTLARRQNKDIAPGERQVIFGVPSEADDDYRMALCTVARAAGFGTVKTVDEPKGALYFHIHRGDITTAEAFRGALVVDFGGGTCDFALLVRGEVKHSWGDMHLGGRLFDDLFYQWFIVQNPGAVAAMRHARAEFFVLAVRCREAKEKFSLAMTLDQADVFHRSMGEFGRISEVTWDAFLKRARHYRPSVTFAQYLQAMNPNAYGHLMAAGQCQGLDLVDWFRQTLRQGLTHDKVRRHDLGCVILTGGSSAWPFVAAIIQEECAHLDRSPRLMHSDRPYITISQGLAIIPALQVWLTATQTALRSELPAFIKTEIAPLIERRLDASAERIAESVTRGLFDERIERTLRNFRKTGGSVADLKARIAAQATDFKSELETIVRDEISKVLTGVAAATTERMQFWFRKHKLTLAEGLTHADTPQDLAGDVEIGIPDIFGDIQVVVLALSTTIVTAMATMIGGPLIASGPIGLAIGAIIGLIAGALAWYYGAEEAKRWAEHWEGTPVWIIARALTDEKIAGLRAGIKGQVAENVKAQSKETCQGLENQIRQRVEQEIENLSAIRKFL